MKKKKEIFWEINMVPFNDILLVLLIIFMMTASFIVTGTGIDISLPSAATAAPQEQTQIAIFITKQGDVYLGGQKVSVENLLDKLTEEAQKNKKVVVIISGDRDVPYGKIVDVLDAVRLSGLEYIALAAELKSPPPNAKVKR
ncbi:biopolymer transporter ExbD [bacterium]|nr:biopolymer transporter ExbD [bacterium]